MCSDCRSFGFRRCWLLVSLIVTVFLGLWLPSAGWPVVLCHDLVVAVLDSGFFRWVGFSGCSQVLGCAVRVPGLFPVGMVVHLLPGLVWFHFGWALLVVLGYDMGPLPLGLVYPRLVSLCGPRCFVAFPALMVLVGYAPPFGVFFCCCGCCWPLGYAPWLLIF